MPLLRDGRTVAGDPVPRLVDDVPMPDDGARVSVSLARFGILDALERERVRSVVIAPTDDPATLLDALPQLDLVVIDFPAYTDGRGYSHARTLRRLGFRGEIRAAGDIRLDELRMLRQAGIDGAELPASIDSESLDAVFSRFPGTYQPSYRPSYRRDAGTT